MSQYFAHNSYCGWTYGTPSDPKLVTAEDATKLMQAAGLSSSQASLILPPAQYAEVGDVLFEATGGNRFIFFGNYTECADVNPSKVASPLVIDWAAT
nr:orf97EGC119 [uncultured bacterium]